MVVNECLHVNDVTSKKR